MKQRDFILLGLILVTAYDVITTIYGTYTILHSGFGAFIASILLAGIIGALLCFSFEIHKLGTDEFCPMMLKPLWLAALGYDLWTSFMGNKKFILQSDGESMDVANIAILVGLTAFVSACPVILSYLRNNTTFLRS